MTTPAEMIEACLCLRLRKASRTVTRTYDDAFRPIGLRSTQLPILVALSLSSSLLMSDLADQLVMDRTTLTRNLKPLEARGMVEIVSGEDKRTRELKLTARGQEAVDVSNQQKWDTLGAERSGAGWRSGELPEGPVVASSPFGG